MQLTREILTQLSADLGSTGLPAQHVTGDSKATSQAHADANFASKIAPFSDWLQATEATQQAIGERAAPRIQTTDGMQQTPELRAFANAPIAERPTHFFQASSDPAELPQANSFRAASAPNPAETPVAARSPDAPAEHNATAALRPVSAQSSEPVGLPRYLPSVSADPEPSILSSVSKPVSTPATQATPVASTPPDQTVAQATPALVQTQDLQPAPAAAPVAANTTSITPDRESAAPTAANQDGKALPLRQAAKGISLPLDDSRINAGSAPAAQQTMQPQELESRSTEPQRSAPPAEPETIPTENTARRSDGEPDSTVDASDLATSSETRDITTEPPLPVLIAAAPAAPQVPGSQPLSSTAATDISDSVSTPLTASTFTPVANAGTQPEAGTQQEAATREPTTPLRPARNPDNAPPSSEPVTSKHPSVQSAPAPVAAGTMETTNPASTAAAPIDGMSAVSTVSERPTPTAGAASTAASGSPPNAAQTGWEQSVRMLVDQQGGRAVLSLNPEHLGTVEIELSVGDERTQLLLNVQNAQSRELMESALPRLREIFLQAGLALDRATIVEQAGTSLMDRNSQHERDADHQRPSATTASSGNPTADETHSLRPAHHAASTSQVDVFA